MSGHFAAIIAIVGPPTYPAPKQQIDVIEIGIGADFTAAAGTAGAWIDFDGMADMIIGNLGFFAARGGC
jgi:hypothetical protein